MHQGHRNPVSNNLPNCLSPHIYLYICLFMFLYIIVQNRAARLIFCAGRRTHTTPLLQELHWFCYRNEAVSYKLCLYVYKIPQRSAPALNTWFLYMYVYTHIYPKVYVWQKPPDKLEECIGSWWQMSSISASRSWHSLPVSSFFSVTFFKVWIICLCKIIRCTKSAVVPIKKKLPIVYSADK